MGPFLGNSTYPIPTVVPTGGINDAKCEMSLLSVLVTLSDLGVTAMSDPKGHEWQSPPGHEKVTKTRVKPISH